MPRNVKKLRIANGADGPASIRLAEQEHRKADKFVFDMSTGRGDLITSNATRAELTAIRDAITEVLCGGFEDHRSDIEALEDRNRNLTRENIRLTKENQKLSMMARGSGPVPTAMQRVMQVEEKLDALSMTFNEHIEVTGCDMRLVDQEHQELAERIEAVETKYDDLDSNCRSVHEVRALEKRLDHVEKVSHRQTRDIKILQGNSRCHLEWIGKLQVFEQETEKQLKALHDAIRSVPETDDELMRISGLLEELEEAHCKWVKEVRRRLDSVEGNVADHEREIGDHVATFNRRLRLLQRELDTKKDKKKPQHPGIGGV